jgi:hypothetical protein
MRGEAAHNAPALDIALRARAAGWAATPEAQVPGSRDAVDLLLVDPEGRRVAVEIELSCSRVRWAVLKARRLDVAHVLIVTSTESVAHRIRRSLRRAPNLFRLQSLGVSVLTEATMPDALTAVLECVPASRRRRKEGRARESAAGRARPRGPRAHGDAAGEVRRPR